MNTPKQIEHAGAMVPAASRITFTQKKNGRFYVGLDRDCFAALLAVVNEDARRASDRECEFEPLRRVRKAFTAYSAKLNSTEAA